MDVKPARVTAVLISASLILTAACTRGNDAASSPAAQPPPAAAGQPAPKAGTDASGAAPSPQSEGAEELTSDEAVAKVLTPWTGDLDGMMERRYVRMLVTFSKTNYFLDGAEQQGLSYDGGKLLEDFLNDRLKTKTVRLHVVFIPVSRDRIFQELAAGRGDIAAAGLTVTPDRQTLVDFSPPLLSGVREVVVTGPDHPAVARAEDLSGRTVHVRRSSSYFGHLTELNSRLRSEGKPAVKIVEAPDALEDEDLLEMVNAGLIPATVVDDYLAEFWTKVFGDIRVQPADVQSDGEIAWAVRKGAPKLREAVDAFARANAKSTRNFNLLYQKYLKSTKYVVNASRESEMKKFAQVRAYFEKYGDQYDLPWLLLAAQGYQESQLDQKRKSHVGAVGVMQIKPSTAEGPPIFIKGVDSSAERNIQAGVKYLRFIVDQYYKDEPMDRVTKGLFAIASYNAGPARITQLRKKTAAMDLDENKWFGNVEVVAAREIGRETVTYVSNIYKYYVAYNLVQQQNEQRRRARGN
jgi:membrane-bound lytic murein transglycosylase MltF